MSRRSKRVNSLIKKELGNIIFRKVDFEEALVTITRVETSDDIQHATVKISAYPITERAKVLEKLRDNIYHLQQDLNKKLQMRPVPKIRFEADQTGDRVNEITEALNEVKEDQNSNS